ncbi:unnamed protein product [Urochloa humidicola]
MCTGHGDSKKSNTHFHSGYKMNGPNKFKVCDDLLYGWCIQTMCVLEDTKGQGVLDMPKMSGPFVSPDERIRNQQA